jgi:hypothetical protein
VLILDRIASRLIKSRCGPGSRTNTSRSKVGTGSLQNTIAMAPAMAYSSTTPSALIAFSARSASANAMVVLILRATVVAMGPAP